MAIPSWINSWWPEFYTSLQAKDALSPVPLIVAALETYRQFNRESELTTFFLNSYGYSVMSHVYGLDPSIVSGFNSRGIYDAGGFVESTLNRPSNYYLTNPEQEVIDVDVINQATAIESAIIQSKGSAGLGMQRRFQLKTLFEDVELVGSPMTKPEVANLYFIQLNWKPVFLSLNVGGLELPSAIA